MSIRPLRNTIVLGGMLALAACNHSEPAAQQTPQVGVVTARVQNVPLIKNFVGRLSAFRTADINARVAGVLLQRTYKEGSEVEADQLLFKIDPAPYKAALDNALGQLAQTQATYTNDHVNAQRLQALAPKGYVSKTDLDNALAAERTAKAAVQAAEATVETARINLGYADVRSPIAGRAGEQEVTEGALVGQGTDTLLTTVDQIDPLYVNFTISIGELDELQQLQRSGGVNLSAPDKTTIKIFLPNGAPYSEPGTLDFSAVNVNPSTNAVNMRALLPNPQHALLPGAFVTFNVNLGERHGAFLIPQPAVQSDINGNYVLVVGKDGKVAHKDVTTSGTSGLNWVVTSGLAVGDQVIVSGIQMAQIGAPAKPEPWQPAASIGTPTGSTSTSADTAGDQ